MLNLPTKVGTEALKHTCSEDGVKSDRENMFRWVDLGSAAVVVVVVISILLSIVFVMKRLGLTE